MLYTIISGDQTSNIRIFSGKQVGLKFVPCFSGYVNLKSFKSFKSLKIAVFAQF